jgi:hypothetical protein
MPSAPFECELAEVGPGYVQHDGAVSAEHAASCPQGESGGLPSGDLERDRELVPHRQNFDQGRSRAAHWSAHCSRRGQGARLVRAATQTDHRSE